jgi:hypothetical protein
MEFVIVQFLKKTKPSYSIVIVGTNSNHNLASDKIIFQDGQTFKKEHNRYDDTR